MINLVTSSYLIESRDLEVSLIYTLARYVARPQFPCVSREIVTYFTWLLSFLITARADLSLLKILIILNHLCMPFQSATVSEQAVIKSWGVLSGRATWKKPKREKTIEWRSISHISDVSRVDLSHLQLKFLLSARDSHVHRVSKSKVTATD